MSYPPPMRFGVVSSRPGMMSGPPPTMSPATIQKPARPNLPPGQKSKLVPQDIEDGEIEKPPVTTVFVGSISDRAPDTMIRTLLQRCGNIVNWKRVQGADGKLQAFGFCEFEVPEATLRCIRLLNEWPIADKKLVVKVDDKTKSMLEDWEKSHVSNEDDVKREDRLALAALDAVMKEFASELKRNAPQQSKARESFGPISSGPKADEGLDDIVTDEDAKNLINREINRFRNTYKDDEVVTEIKPSSRDKKDERDHDRDRDRGDRDRDRRRGESTEKSSRGERRDRSDRKDRGDRSDRDRERDRSAKRDERDERGGSRRRTRSRSADRGRNKAEEIPDEDPDERYERLRLERQLRDKEQAYQERLKNWEVRERKKIREFERDRQRSEERKQEEKKEARRLKEFLEDYEDERDDPKYYRGSDLHRRMREREKEAEADNRDRLKEREEIEELRKKLTEEGHPDPESEISKRQNPKQHREEEAAAQVSNGNKDVAESQDETSRHSYSSSSNHHRQTSMDQDTPSQHSYHRSSTSNEPAQSSHSAHRQHHSHAASSSQQGADYTDGGKRKRLSVKDVFNNDEDESTADVKKKRPLVPLDYEDDKKRSGKSSIEDKRASIKKLIERIPTDKHDLFSWPMDWDQVDQVLLDNRIKPWVNKKITEYIGEEEPTLTDFICQKVMTKSSAVGILNDVAMVLDEEAETFVVKMWRLLVYETEAKKAGLVK